MDYPMALALVVVTICSYFSFKVWVIARRKERESFYRAEAVKKIVDVQGAIPESVLETLRDTLEQKPEAPSSWGNFDYNREREAYYRSETLKRVATAPGGAAAVMEYLRQEDNRALRRREDFMKLAGMITTAAGVGMMILIRLLDNSKPVYLVGFIPVLVGAALLVYAFRLAPVTGERN